MLIDDFAHPGFVSRLGTSWRAVSDRVMGGVSEAGMTRAEIGGRHCLRLTGDVCLENNGGFIQAALDLAPADGVLDARGFEGLRIVASGNAEHYGLHLRTPDCRRPWQSYRAEFEAGEDWRSIELPFSRFHPYRLTAPLDTRRLRRLGLVAIGRAFHADLRVASIGFYPLSAA